LPIVPKEEIKNEAPKESIKVSEQKEPKMKEP